MQRYSQSIIDRVRNLRSRGKTYGEIRTLINLEVPKSTLSEWCKRTKLPKDYLERISKLNVQNLDKGRKIALEINKIKKEEFFQSLTRLNSPIAKRIIDKEIAKIALAMICLGEASKYNPHNRTSFYIGSSDPRIIVLFLELLKYCFNFDLKKVRCTVQCRADQNTKLLENFWMKVTKIPKRLFYKARIDPRTIGKPTRKSSYKGVLKIDYFDCKVQHDLESLSDLVYNFTAKGLEV